MTTQQSITSGQRKQYLRFVEDAAELALARVGLDKDGAQKLIERGDEFQARIVTAIRELSVSNRYADEEVGFSFSYLSDYKLKGVAEQVAVLRELFPELKDATYDEGVEAGELPSGAEWWFAISRSEKLAASYNEAGDKVLALIGSKRRLANFCEGETGLEYLRQSEKKEQAFQQIAEQQAGHDILVVPAQFGLRHQGRSVRRAREVMSASEFGLGAYEVGIMLLTHPERLQHLDDLRIDCAGDEYSPRADGQFDSAPSFDFDDGGLGFISSWTDYPDHDWGSSSGFLPQ